MPIYLYLDDRTGVTHEIMQSMKEEHRAYASDGYELKRVFVNPQARVNSTDKLDPMNPRAYVDLTKEKKGNLGNLQDLAKELSMKRQDKIGIDPVREKHFDRYAKIRKGKEHPIRRKEKLEKLIKNPIEMKIK